MKLLLLIMDMLNGSRQEADFRAKHQGAEVVVVTDYDQLEAALAEHAKEIKGGVYIGGMSDPVSVGDATRMINDSRAGGKKSSTTTAR